MPPVDWAVQGPEEPSVKEGERRDSDRESLPWGVPSLQFLDPCRLSSGRGTQIQSGEVY